MPSGKRKRRQAGGQFQTGHTYYAGRWSNNDDEIPGPSSASQCHPDQSDEEPHGPDLRPRRHLQETEASKRLGHRIVDLDSVISMLNALLLDHQNGSPKCRTMAFRLQHERKVGLGSDLRFVCTACNFISRTYKTYQPPAGNTRGAVMNKLLASALLQTPLGAEQANILLCSMDLPNVSRSHLQKLISEAAKNVKQINDQNMAEKRQEVIQHNFEKGATDPTQLDVSFDCRYNGKLNSSYKPGTGASQAYGVCTENHTSKKYVIGLTTENKLCWTGSYLRNKGFDVECPGGHEGCTANTKYMQPHSERRMAHDMASQLHADDMLVRTVTTDGDTKSFLGMQDFYGTLDEAWEVTRQADQNHLGSTQERRARRANWSQNMFPNKTGTARQEAIRAFAKDIKSRCTMIVKKLRALGDGDITKKLGELPKVCSATVECYSGNCHFCPHESYVCLGLGGLGDWWYHSQYLPTHDIDRLDMTENDKELLRKILEIRLSERAIKSVASNTGTQKCEAFNRSTLANLPKAINHSRNFDGRVAVKTLQINNNLDFAIQTTASEVMGHKLSQKPARYIETRSKQAERKKQQQKTTEYKQKRRQTRADNEFRYHQFRSGCGSVQHAEEHEYSKGQLD